MKLTSLTLFLLALSFMVLADTNTLSKEQTQAVDEIFSEWDKTDTPGCALGIIKDGQLIYSRGYGMANLEYNLPNNSQSVFRIGSTSKQFTAASIIILAQKGKLSLDDTLHKFFPDFPDYAKNITVRHLLNHTSGIKNYLTLAILKGWNYIDNFTHKDVMRWLTNQTELNFEPGQEYGYSNSGYWLLGQIINQVAEMSPADFAMQEIFKPLGMNSTHFNNDYTQIVKNRATGYMPHGEGKYHIRMTTLDMTGAGGIFTTVDDMKKWDDAYYDSQVLGKTFWKMMTQKGVLNNGETLDYASGLEIRDYKGLKTISHDGGFAGYVAQILRFPEQKFSVVLLINRGDASPTDMAFKVAEVFLKHQYVEEDKKPENADNSSNANVTEKDILFTPEQVVGNYELRPGLEINITLINNKLHAVQKWNGKENILIKSEFNSYINDNAEKTKFTFTELKDNSSQKMIADSDGKKWQWVRKDPIDLSATNVQEYVGNYYSKALDVTYKITSDDESLNLQIEYGDLNKLVVIKKDQLFYRGIILQFNRESSEISEFTMDAFGDKNFKFIKQ
jgi:CubicO group peptidase (beta-lactamase class C family)